MKWAVLLVLLCGFGCTEHNVNQQRSGIWISFDDRSIEDWAAFYPVIEKYGAKCTFFVTQPDSISAKEFELLKSLQRETLVNCMHSWVATNLDL